MQLPTTAELNLVTSSPSCPHQHQHHQGYATRRVKLSGFRGTGPNRAFTLAESGKKLCRLFEFSLSVHHTHTHTHSHTENQPATENEQDTPSRCGGTPSRRGGTGERADSRLNEPQTNGRSGLVPAAPAAGSRGHEPEEEAYRNQRGERRRAPSRAAKAAANRFSAGSARRGRALGGNQGGDWMGRDRLPGAQGR